MSPILFKSRVYKALPALLLAVFLSTQIGLVGHLHADDSNVADCLQCQFDTGQATVASCHSPVAYAAATIVLAPPLLAAPVSAVYAHKARGPPALS